MIASIARRRLSRLPKEEGGGVAILMALAAMPLTLLAFAAVEFNNYSTSRGDLQDALDAAAMSVARSSETDPVKLEALGVTVLTQTFGGAGGRTGYTLSNVTFNDVDGVVTGKATLKLEAIVSSLFGAQELTMSAQSKASRLGEKLEIALVLDNTYSMLTNDRLGITKAAATKFVDTLAVAAARTRVADALKISLVPYSDSVRLPVGDRGAAWIDSTAVSPIHDDLFLTRGANRFTLLQQMGATWAGCVESREHPFDVQDVAPTSTDPRTLFVPYFAPDEPDDWTYGWTNDYLPDETKPRATWDQRQKNTWKYDQAPLTTTIGNGYNRGPNYGCTLQPIVRLTTDMSDLGPLKTGIRNMTAAGDTYTNIGLMWGWHSLSPSAPFSDGAVYGSGAKKIAILMTDGENKAWDNFSPNAGIYSGGAYIAQGRFGITSGTQLERRTALDARMSQVCANMKAKGIVVYTIRVEVTEGDGAVLRNCATSPEKFFNVAKADQLDATFKAIADSLLNLRIAG